MGSFLTGALSGVVGGIDKYGQIQNDQRKYNMDQKKIQAETLRKENFARFQHKLTQSGRGSGMVTQTGQEYTKGELEGLDEEGRTSAISKFEFQEGVKKKQAGEKAELKQADYDAAVSKDFTLKDGTPVTNAEAASMVEGGQQDQLLNKMQRDIKVKSEASEAKDTAAVKKLKTQSTTKFVESINEIIKAPVDETLDDPADKLKDIVTAMRQKNKGSDAYKEALSIDIVREAIATEQLATVAAKAAKDAGGKMTFDSTRVEAARKALTDKKIPVSEHDKILSYAGLI